MNPSNNNSRNPPANANKNANRDRQASASAPKLPPSGVPFGHLPAFLPGSASLVEQLDRRIMIVLRDGRHLVGVLRSFDQFSNMVLEDTSERRVLHLKKGGDTICYYTDIQLGLYLVRGDSMVLLGEVDVTEDTDADADADTGEEEKEKDETQQDDGDGDMMGSGLLGGGQGQEREVAEAKKKFMKEVSLEEFEKLQEEHENDAVEDLTWEFDMDLVA
jgi:U6 snRNA-associated Sm-like protein LSm1